MLCNTQGQNFYIGICLKFGGLQNKILNIVLVVFITAMMLPHIFPAYPDRTEFDVFALMKPAREVGGDFYDFFLIDDDHLCLVMADVSGKGIPAALFMMISKTILQSCAMLGVSAGEILTKMNDALCSNNQVEMFVTVWVGILEISTGKVTCGNAGHEYPAIMGPDGNFKLYKDKHDVVIGWIEDHPYREYTLQLEPGDKLFLYTDGVPEATDKEDRMFGTDRLPQTGNNSPLNLLTAVLALTMTAAGGFAVRASGILRRKQDSES